MSPKKNLNSQIAFIIVYCHTVTFLLLTANFLYLICKLNFTERTFRYKRKTAIKGLRNAQLQMLGGSSFLATGNQKERRPQEEYMALEMMLLSECT